MEKGLRKVVGAVRRVERARRDGRAPLRQTVWRRSMVVVGDEAGGIVSWWVRRKGRGRELKYPIDHSFWGFLRNTTGEAGLGNLVMLFTRVDVACIGISRRQRPELQGSCSSGNFRL